LQSLLEHQANLHLPAGQHYTLQNLVGTGKGSVVSMAKPVTKGNKACTYMVSCNKACFFFASTSAFVTRLVTLWLVEMKTGQL